MPASIDSLPEENTKILPYVGSVGFLVFSLMMTGFGYVNNAWVVMGKETDEFQRGVRGLDCYRTFQPENISCLPWGYEHKSDKFPQPFSQVEDADIGVNVAYYVAIVILVSQFFWLSYTIGLCCSLKFCERVITHKLVLFHAMVTTVGVWIILFLIYMFEVIIGNYLPISLETSQYSYRIGLGCWIFFLGGMIPFVGALHCLFGEETSRSAQRMREFVRRRFHRVPTEIPLTEVNQTGGH